MWLRSQGTSSYAGKNGQHNSRTSVCILIILCSFLISPTISQEGNDLCTDEDCTCNSQGSPDLIDVNCRCSPKKVRLSKDNILLKFQSISLMPYSNCLNI